MSDQTDIRLTGWGTFDDLAVSIRALLFGEMVKRGVEVIGEYHSDLYHDALWLHGNVHGEMSFVWIVRPSGTHIGNTAQIVYDAPSLWQKGGVAYVVHLFPRGGEWFAWFEVVKDDRPPACHVEDCTLSTRGNGLRADGVCPVHGASPSTEPEVDDAPGTFGEFYAKVREANNKRLVKHMSGTQFISDIQRMLNDYEH